MTHRTWLRGVAAAFVAASSIAASAHPHELAVTQRGSAPAGAPVVIGPTNRNWMAAHLIDVGQGAATLFEFSCGVVLIDTGGGARQTGDWTARFERYLDGVFARRPDLNRRLDVVILTHPHSDHTSGAPVLTQSRYQVRHIVTNAQPNGSGINQQNRLTRYAEQQRIGITRVRNSALGGSRGLTNGDIDPLRCNGDAPDIRLLWGSSDTPPRWPSNGNNHSVVVRIDFGESSFLVVGDLEEDAQEAMIEHYEANRAILDVDIYQLGHHGSRNGTSGRLVRAMSPELALIGAGDPSRRELYRFSAYNFGHPNRAAINLLSDPVSGVTMRRPAKAVGVGIRGRSPNGEQGPEFETMQLDRAIFSTGWDGNVVVFANMAGEKRVVN